MLTTPTPTLPASSGRSPAGFPPDYDERVYAGVLGKMIGVYLGRPFEGWTHERIVAELGSVTGYLHERFGVPLIVTDDDLSGTFTFLRALEDSGFDPKLSPAEIGQAWLNYIVPGRTILWWGGLGNSTEHTAFLRLQGGLDAPESGSARRNGTVASEQIGAQIFIDGWAMVAPGNPGLAADLAGRAARVSHDGEAVHAARLLAAMEAWAFVEPDIEKIIDTGLALVPADCTIARLVHDLLRWRGAEPDWRETRARVAATYGYSRYPGVCPVVPNHALVLMSLLYAPEDFSQAMTIVNTSGWDTDCNAGNVGCLLGIKNGLAGLDGGPDWRGPVADRLYLPTAEGGRAITDALTEAYRVANAGRALAGLDPVRPKGGARFHFDLPGAVQGFRPDEDSAGVLDLENQPGGRLGRRCLALRYRNLGPGRTARAATPTFSPPEGFTMPGYELLASPTLHPGQRLVARLAADPANPAPVRVRLYLRWYGPADELVLEFGPEASLEAGGEAELVWRVPEVGGPVAEVGLELGGEPAETGTVLLDSLGWEGAPEVTLGRPPGNGTAWRRAWVSAVDHFDPHWPEAFRIAQDRGTGLLLQGGLEWRDYVATSRVTPYLVSAGGLVVRAGGLRRHYALRLERGVIRLVKTRHLETVLAEAPLEWAEFQEVELSLEAVGHRLRAWVDGRLVFEVEDLDRPLEGGGAGLLVREGTLSADAITVRPSVLVDSEDQ